MLRLRQVFPFLFATGLPLSLAVVLLSGCAGSRIAPHPFEIKLADLQPMTPIHGEGVWVVRYSDQTVAAFADRAVDGCEIRWIGPADLQSFFGGQQYPDEFSAGIFRKLCSGTTYDLNGNHIFGPGSGGLDHLPTRVESGVVVVDIG